MSVLICRVPACWISSHNADGKKEEPNRLEHQGKYDDLFLCKIFGTCWAASSRYDTKLKITCFSLLSRYSFGNPKFYESLRNKYLGMCFLSLDTFNFLFPVSRCFPKAQTYRRRMMVIFFNAAVCHQPAS